MEKVFILNIKIDVPKFQFSNEIGEEEKEQFIKDYTNRLWYYKVYQALVNKCKNLETERKLNKLYTEKHHIVPKCMGGPDNRENLVKMIAREHIMAHLLLMLIFPNVFDLAFSASVTMFGNKNTKPWRDLAVKKFSTRTVAMIKEKSAKARKLAGASEKLIEFNRTRLGIPLSEEHKKKVSESLKGRDFSEEHRRHLSEANTGTKLSDETRKKISENHKGRHISEESKKKGSETRDKNGWEFNKKVIGLDGTIYDNAKSCAKIVGIHYGTLIRYINHKPEKGFKYYTDSTTKDKTQLSNKDEK